MKAKRNRWLCYLAMGPKKPFGAVVFDGSWQGSNLKKPAGEGPIDDTTKQRAKAIGEGLPLSEKI